jgi:hypothetical protein
LAVLEAQGNKMVKQIYLAITVGQEVNGKNVVVRVDKASFSKTTIEDYLRTEKNSWVEKHTFPEGEASCYFERHAQEVEVIDE